MIELALKAGLPVIGVQTDDLVNLEMVLGKITEASFTEVKSEKVHTLGEPANYGRYFFGVELDELDMAYVYNRCLENNVTLVLVNYQHHDTHLFNAGWLKVPPEVVNGWLTDLVDPSMVREVAGALAGLSLKDMAEVMNLSTAEYGDVQAVHLLHIRKMVFQAELGLSPVDTDQSWYIPPDWMSKWLAVDGKLFNQDTPTDLVPRGLLFDGEPGTGKTMGAKELAREMGIPLYRLELGSLLNKYIGESEGNLQRLLGKIDQNEPCALLLDEVEKLFQQGGDSEGTTSRLLSQLLWWLQEHRSKVLTFMTTNKRTALPPELYRPGRIDAVYTFQGLTEGQAWDFLWAVWAENLESKIEVNLSDQNMTDILKKLYAGEEPGHVISQAKLVHGMNQTLKQLLINP